jgi:hypothetical protein
MIAKIHILLKIYLLKILKSHNSLTNQKLFAIFAQLQIKVIDMEINFILVSLVRKKFVLYANQLRKKPFND